jgi:hypothetical protein
MQDIVQNYKAVSLIAPVVQTSTTTGTGVDVEVYGEDAMVVVNAGTVSGGSPSTVVTVVGSLPATPTTYDQTLATFVAATAAGLGATDINLSGIKNIRAVATQTGAGNVPISIVLLAQSRVAGSTLNSTTLA